MLASKVIRKERLPFLVIGSAVLVLGVLLLAIAIQRPPFPTNDECIDVWNSSRNQANQTALTAFAQASVIGYHVDGRGAGCSVVAWHASGEWMIFGADIMTWDERPVDPPAWSVQTRGERWGVDSPDGDLDPPNVTIQGNGRLTPRG